MKSIIEFFRRLFSSDEIVVNVTLEGAAFFPTYKTDGSAGCDVCSIDDVTIGPGERMLVNTGLKVEIPRGYECQVRPRSGLALEHGITVFNTPGTVDSDYRGLMKVLMFNASSVPFKVTKGMRIAQFVFARHARAVFVEKNALSTTTRGTGGWGSTGLNS